MQLTINARETQGVAILELNGRIQLGEEVDGVGKMIHDLVVDFATRLATQKRAKSPSERSGCTYLVLV